MKQLDGVLIDNNVWVRSHWEQRCRQHGKMIRTFASVGQFFNDCTEPDIDKMMPVFIDSQLDDADGAGEELAKKIYAAGFRNIFLATSYPPKNKADYPHLRGYVSKEPPKWFVSSVELIQKNRHQLLEKMNCEQRCRLDVRMRELNAVRNGDNQMGWPMTDGSGAYWPEEVLDAWEAAIYYDPTDRQLETVIHEAWLETID